MNTLDTRISARSVDGLVTTRDLVALGYNPRAIDSLVRHENLHRVRRGFYAVAPPEDAKARHRLRTLAELRVYPTAMATAISALTLYELPVVAGLTGPVHLLSSDPETRSRNRGARLWSAQSDSNKALANPAGSGALRVVRPALAIAHAGCAEDAWTFLAAADAALRIGLASVEGILEATQEQRWGMGRMRRVVHLIDGRRESPGESGAALLLHDLGFETEPQVWIGPYRVDLLIKGTRVIVEFDGAVKYDNRAALVEEKRREDALRARGYTVVRLMWPDLGQPKRVRGLVTSALARAA